MKFSEFEQALAGRFLERERVIHGILVALVAGQHVLLLGSPGTAKSDMALAVCEGIGGRFFRTTLTPTSVPDELFGPVDIKRLTEEGVYARTLHGTLATADLAVVDEVFKCNAATLNSLLSVVNEREVLDAGAMVKVPLRTLVGTSNELPQDDSLGALWDRFSLRYVVEPLRAPADWLKMMEMGEPSPAAGPTLTEIANAADLVPTVEWSPIRETFLKVWQAARQTWRVDVSDRRWRWCLRLVQANALLAGRMTCQPSDLLILSDALWQEPGQRQAIRQGLLDVVDPALREAEDLTDAAEEQWRKVDGMDESDPGKVTATNMEAATKFKQAEARLTELVDLAKARGQDAAGIAALRDRVRGYNRALHQRIADRMLSGGGDVR